MRVITLQTRAQAKEELTRIGADPAGIELMAPKMIHRVLKLEGVPLKAALLLKQEALAVGGEAAVRQEVANLSVEKTDVLLAGTVRQLEILCDKLRWQPFGLADLAARIKEALQKLDRPPSVFRCGWHQFSLGERTFLLGILNVTPDSFSDGGKYLDPEKAVAAARTMVAAGADIIDIGAESTRPGAVPVSAEEEWRRLEPVLRHLVKEVVVPVSVDTYKAEVAAKALAMGARIINDISGLRADPEMAKVIGRAGGAVIIMHRKGEPAVMQENPSYTSLMDEIMTYLEESVQMALAAGISAESIIIDPGIGFGKTVEHNLEILRRLSELRTLGYPILVGTSRKSFIGKTLNLPVEDRLEGTAATISIAISQGADFIRVHDVQAMRRVADMTDAIVRRKKV